MLRPLERALEISATKKSARCRGVEYLQNAFHIGLREIIADEQQATVMRLGDFISETVAEIQPRRMDALPPVFIGGSDPPPGGRRYSDNVEAKAGDQFRQLPCDLAPSPAVPS